MLDAIKLVKRDHCRDLVGIDTICCCPFSNNVHQADFLMLLFFDVCLAEKFTIGLWNPNRESFGKCFWELQIIRWRFSYGVSRPVWSNARVCSTSSSTCCPSLHSSSWYPFSRCTDYVQKLFAGKLNLSLDHIRDFLEQTCNYIWHRKDEISDSICSTIVPVPEYMGLPCNILPSYFILD